MKSMHVLDCPSAQPEWRGSAVIGVVGGTVKEPRVAFLEATLAVTPELLAKTAPVHPTEVLRFKATCIEGKCVHFKHRECTLVSRMLAALKPVSEDLPPCQIRNTCRWFYQSGNDACLRCPQVVTRYAGPSDELHHLSVTGNAEV
jgi:hypothetical protein